jgi:hypothetical protein
VNKKQKRKVFSDVGTAFMDIGKLVFAGFVLVIAISEKPEKLLPVAAGGVISIVLIGIGVLFGKKSEE